ncbi:endonuclease domain-containing protein [Luteimicrobium sp. DT211]|uniref:endonuclease domain-containing protein n=1 Tax=Luteimicrobium sp. DT211 TaxID=3393412 RepID=UPI003CEE0B3D
MYRRLLSAGGTARYGELVRTGADQAPLKNLLAEGMLVRAGFGVYVLPTAHPDLIVAARFDAHVDCVSALPLQDVATLHRPAVTHLHLPRDHGGNRWPARELRRVRLHRSDDEPGFALVDGRVRSVERALARALTCVPRDEAVVALDSALWKGFATVEGVSRHLPRNAPARVWSALALADPGGKSVIETLARLALVDAGFTVRTQARFEDVGDVDLLVEGLVVVECDGYEYHKDRVTFRNDRRRDRILHAGGLVVLRFTYEDIVDDPTCVVRAVRAALATRPPGFRVVQPIR